jgi:hypothetical protein
MHEYLGLESGLPIFEQDFTCPALLDMSIIAACTGLSPLSLAFPDYSSSLKLIA